MKPRWTECDLEALKILRKAKDLEERIEKAGWEGAPTEGSKISGGQFEVETGGRITHRPQFWTNQSLIESDNVEKKIPAAASDPINMMQPPPNQYGPEGSTLYSHETGGEGESSALG